MFLLPTVIVSAAVEKVAAQRSSSDHLIVPGKGVGPVSLGISQTELYRIMGEPTETWTGSEGATYTFGPLVVFLDYRTGVFQIQAKGSEFATPEGIRVGDSALALEAKLGPPQSREKHDRLWIYDYRSKGIRFGIMDGHIVDIYVRRQK